MAKARATVEQPKALPQPPFPTRKILIAGALLLFAIFGVYRLLTFTPQPLDSPGTLRPVLYGMFTTLLGNHPNPEKSQGSWGNYALLAMFVPTLLAWVNYLSGDVEFRRGWLGRILYSRTLLLVSVAVSLFVCRFPALLADQLNPDEPLFLAAAQKLFRDPIFFRAVDCGTSGPFNVYPLMLPALLGFSPDYASSRVIGLIVIFCSIYFIYRALVLLTGDRLARIAMLPAAGAFACLKHFDFLHYSSEHVSFVFLAAAVFLCAKIFRAPEAYRWPLVGIGILVSATFFAKLQAVPIIACAAFVAMAYIYRYGGERKIWRPAVLFGAGLAPLLLLNAIVCLAAGVWHDFWMEYIVANYRYAATVHQTVTAQLNQFADLILNKVAEMRALIATLVALLAIGAYQKWRQKLLFVRLIVVGGAAAAAAVTGMQAGGETALSYAGVLALFTVPVAFFFVWRHRDADSAPRRWFGFLSSAILAAATVAAYTPHRPFGHYLLLVMFPVAITMAWPVVVNSAAEIPMSLLAAFSVILLAGQFMERGTPDVVNFVDVRAGIKTPDARVIDALTQSTDNIAVWGWNARPYVSAGRLSATPHIDTANLVFVAPDVRAYYRGAYLKALQQHTPPLFIDATEASVGGPAQRRAMRLEMVPQVKWFVDSNYVHLLDAYDERFLIQRDLAAKFGLGEPRHCDPQAIRCFEWNADARQPADLAALQMPERARIEIVFTPESDQEADATVVSNAPDTTSQRGFMLHHVSADRYRLMIGNGSRWIASKEISFPQRKLASLSIDIGEHTVTMVCDGAKCDEMWLPDRMTDSPAPITVGSWVDHQRPFLGNIALFQIRPGS